MAITADGALGQAVNLDVVIVGQQEHHQLKDVAHGVHIETANNDMAATIDGGSQTVTDQFCVAPLDGGVGVEAKEVHLIDQRYAWFSEKLVQVRDQAVFHGARNDMEILGGIDSSTRVEAVRIALIADRLDADEWQVPTPDVNELSNGICLIALASAHGAEAEDRFTNVRGLALEQRLDLATNTFRQA